MSLGIVAGLVALTACQAAIGTLTKTGGPVYAPDEWPAGGLLELAANDADTPPAGTLTVYLEKAQDREGRPKISHSTGLTKASLMAPGDTPTEVKVGTLIGTESVRFDLANLKPGDYFIKFNDLADDLVPARIPDPGQRNKQWVGFKLRNAVIGDDEEEPAWRIKTYAKGQLISPAEAEGQYGTVYYHRGQFVRRVVKFSNGTPTAVERYSYAINSPAETAQPSAVEIRVLGTDALLSFKTASGHHGGSGWTLGDNNHGKAATAIAEYANGANPLEQAGTCAKQHGGITAASTPSATFINPSKDLYWQTSAYKGWDGKATESSAIPAYDYRNIGGTFQCYRCHYGPGGERMGFVDPRE